MTAGSPRTQIDGSERLLGRVADALVAAYPRRLDRIDAGKTLGVAGRTTCALAICRPVGIDAWLAWCAALGLDPINGEAAGKSMPGFSGGRPHRHLGCDGVAGRKRDRRVGRCRRRHLPRLQPSSAPLLQPGAVRSAGSL